MSAQKDDDFLHRICKIILWPFFVMEMRKELVKKSLNLWEGNLVFSVVVTFIQLMKHAHKIVRVKGHRAGRRIKKKAQRLPLVGCCRANPASAFWAVHAHRCATCTVAH